MQVYWSNEFDRQLARFEQAATRSPRDQKLLDLLALMLKQLRDLGEEPAIESAMLKRVRQSGRHRVWRQSHPFENGVALRLICWFPEDSDTVVVTLFAGDKASMGDVFYDSVGIRADQIIEQWFKEQQED